MGAGAAFLARPCYSRFTFTVDQGAQDHCPHYEFAQDLSLQVGDLVRQSDQTIVRY